MSIRPDFFITADVYNETQVGVFRTRERFNAWRAEHGCEPTPNASNATAARITDDDGYPWYGVFVPPRCPVETVCHECLHLAWYILDMHGVKVSAMNHEALAYLMQHLSRQLLHKRK